MISIDQNYQPPGPMWAAVRLVRVKWILVLAMVLGSLIGGGLRALTIPRRWSAAIRIAAVSNEPNAGSFRTLAGLAGVPAESGFSVTPEVVAAIFNSRLVLSRVLQQPVMGNPSHSIGDVLLPETGKLETVADRVRLLRRNLVVVIDRDTGLIDVSFAWSDSSLARSVVMGCLEETNVAVAEITKSRAEGQLEGREVHLSASRDSLDVAEEKLALLQRHNSVIEPYSEVMLEYQRLERRVKVFQETYLQALSRHEAAIEQIMARTPAIVVVDPLSPTLPKKSRNIAFFGIMGGIISISLVGLVVLVWERMIALANNGDRNAVALVESLRRGRPNRDTER